MENEMSYIHENNCCPYCKRRKKKRCPLGKRAFLWKYKISTYGPYAMIWRNRNENCFRAYADSEMWLALTKDVFNDYNAMCDGDYPALKITEVISGNFRKYHKEERIFENFIKTHNVKAMLLAWKLK